MPETPHLLAFVGAALVLLVTPGPAVLFVVTRSVHEGRLAGLVSTLGLTAGGLVHVAAAVVGLSALLAASAGLFTAVKLVGAGYLLYLGIRTLRGPAAPPVSDARRGGRLGRHFFDGFVVNVFNPKAAIFFMAFLPQFVDPERGEVRPQLLLLGFLFLALAFLTDGAYALAAGSVRGWIARKPGFWRVQRAVSGTVYLGLGLTAALAGRRID